MISNRSLCCVLLLWLPAASTAVPQNLNLAKPKLLTKIDFKGGSANQSLAFSKNGSQIWTNRIEAWNVDSGTKVVDSPFGKQKFPRYIFDLSLDKPLILIGNRQSNELMFWTTKINEARITKNDHQGKVVAIKLFDNNQRYRVLFSDPPSIYSGFLDSKEKDEVWTLDSEAHRGVFSTNASLLATRDKNVVKVLDPFTKKTKTTLSQASEVKSLAISNDSTLIATGGNDNIVRIFDVEKGKLLGNLAGHGKGDIFLPVSIYSLAFSPNGNWLASGGHDGQVIIWNVKTLKPVLKMQIGGPPIVHAVTFSPDSRKFAASFENAGAKHGIRIWQLPGDNG